MDHHRLVPGRAGNRALARQLLMALSLVQGGADPALDRLPDAAVERQILIQLTQLALQKVLMGDVGGAGQAFFCRQLIEQVVQTLDISGGEGPVTVGLDIFRGHRAQANQRLAALDRRAGTHQHLVDMGRLLIGDTHHIAGHYPPLDLFLPEIASRRQQHHHRHDKKTEHRAQQQGPQRRSRGDRPPFEHK